MGDDGECDAGHVAHEGRPPGGAVDDRACRDPTARGAHAGDAAAFYVDARHLGVLMDVDAARIGAPGVAPVDGVVADDAARRMVQRPEDRVACARRDVEKRHEPLHLRRPDHFGLYPLELVHLGAPAHGPQ